MVYRKIKVLMIVLIFIAGFSAIASNVCAEDEIPGISKEEAREKLDDSGVIFLDARLAGDWQSSRFKIKGAVRADPEKTEQWLGDYEADRTYMIYCE
ncbi:MAG: rhodanese-like domain-containing protein [Thermodesulfobacteriota bacterium]